MGHSFWHAQIWHGSGEYCWGYREDTILSTDGHTDGRMDGQTDKVKPVYPPFDFVETGGIIIDKVLRIKQNANIIILQTTIQMHFHKEIFNIWLIFPLNLFLNVSFTI